MRTAEGLPPTPQAPSLRLSARACGISGLLFAMLLVTALVLVRQAPSLGVPDAAYADFYRTTGRGNVLVTVGLYVVPFAGIAFLWHLSAMRTLIDAMPGATSPVQGWLQLGSGIVFVCMLFTGTAAVGAVALVTVFSSSPLPPPTTARSLSGVGYGLVFIFGVRAAGMFMFATTTLLRRQALLPRWLAVVSYLAAAFLLLTTTFHPAVMLVFPGWVSCVSIALLVRARRETSPLSAVHVTPAPVRPSPEAHAGDPGNTSSHPAPVLSPQETSHEHDHRP